MLSVKLGSERSQPEQLDRSRGTPTPVEPNAHRSRSISDVSLSVLIVDTIRVRALCVDEPQLGCISSGRTMH